MTKVYLEQHDNRYTVSAKGHATGSTDVCAAISILLYTLVVYLRNSTVTVDIERIDTPADVLIVFSGEDKAEDAIDFVTAGFLQLAKQDPTLISVERRYIS